MKKIKVLFITYPSIGLNRGGLQIQIEKTAEALIDHGVDVVFYDPWKNQLPEVDLCHVFSVHSAAIYHVVRAVGIDRPVVISPVMGRAAGNVWWAAIKVMMSRLPALYSDLERSRSMMMLASKVISQNVDEKVLLDRVFKLSSKKSTIVPNGVDKKMGEGDPGLFFSKYGIKDFVLQVGSISYNKNQICSIKAISNLPYDLVIIGGATPDNQGYLSKCKDVAGKNVHFLGELSYNDPLLSSAYAAAKMLVVPSYTETWGLIVYEAAVSSCKVVVSKGVPVPDNILNYIPKFSPRDHFGLSELIDYEMRLPIDKKLKSIVNDMPDWVAVAHKIEEIYHSLLSDFSVNSSKRVEKSA